MFWALVAYGIAQAIAESQRIEFREALLSYKEKPKREVVPFEDIPEKPIKHTQNTLKPVVSNNKRQNHTLENGKETIVGNAKTIEFDVIYK